MSTSRDCKEFKWMNETYRVRPDGAIQRYDGPKIGWTLTHSAAPRAIARELGLLPEGY